MSPPLPSKKILSPRNELPLSPWAPPEVPVSESPRETFSLAGEGLLLHSSAREFRNLRQTFFNPDFSDFLRGLLPSSEPDNNSSPDVEENPPPASPGIFENIWNGIQNYWEGLRVFCGESPVNPPHPEAAVALSETRADPVEDILRFEKCDAAERETLWREAVAQLQAEGFAYAPDPNSTYADFRTRLEHLGAHLPFRVLSLRNALTLLHHRETLGEEPVELPIALVIGPTEDYNGHFNSIRHFSMLDTLVASERFHVLYFEAGGEDEVEEILERVTSATGRRIHTWVLGGHGNPTTLSLGGSDTSASGSEEHEGEFIQIRDFVEGDFANLADYIEPEGQVLLWSCSTGAGEETSVNLANTLASALPGRRIHSTPVPNGIKGMEIHEDLSLEVLWWFGQTYLAQFEEGDILLFTRHEQSSNG